MPMPLSRTAFSVSFLFILLCSALLSLAPRAAQAQAPAATVEASDGSTLMTVFDDGGFTVLGEVDAGAIPVEGGGPG